MSSSCGERPLFWTVTPRESRPSMSDGSRTERKWQRTTASTCSPTAPFIFPRSRAEEETNQTKGFISASLRTNTAQSWARKPVLQSQVSNLFILKRFQRFWVLTLICLGCSGALGAPNQSWGGIGVFRKEKHRSGDVQDNVKNRRPPIHMGAFHVFAWSLCSFKMLFPPALRRSAPQSNRGEAEGWVGVLGHLHLTGGWRGCLFHFHPADILSYILSYILICAATFFLWCSTEDPSSSTLFTDQHLVLTPNFFNQF